MNWESMRQRIRENQRQHDCQFYQRNELRNLRRAIEDEREAILENAKEDAENHRADEYNSATYEMVELERVMDALWDELDLMQEGRKDV